MSNLNYYPLKRVREKLGEEETDKMVIVPSVRGRSYSFATMDGEHLIVEVNHHYNITLVNFTPRYKSIGRALLRAKRNGYKACWHIGNARTSR